MAVFLNSSPQELLIEYTEIFDQGDQHDYNVEYEYYDHVSIDSKDGYRLNLGKGQYWNDAARATTVKGNTNGKCFLQPNCNHERTLCNKYDICY